MLKLRIENFDRLPDGGPLEYRVDKRGFDFGRDSHLDWTLPDKSRVISGKHCEIRYYDDAYWLVDISTNGTFANGSSKRVKSPYQLNEGDKLQVGEYVLSVSLELPPLRQHAVLEAEIAPPAQRAGSIWDTGGVSPPPLDARALMPKVAPGEVGPDYLNQALYVPAIAADEPVFKPQPAVGAAWSAEPSSPPAALPVASTATPGNFARHFAKGAGLPEDTFDTLDEAHLAELTGQLLHLTCSHLMGLLQARAEAKAISRTGKRTLVKAAENNPLKFMPSPEEALHVMLMPRGKSYLGAKETLDSTFADLKSHHFALLAAMQAAANELLTELSPDAVAKSSEVKKSLLGGGKAKLWDDLVTRWAAKSGRRENGALDAFLDAFAEHYDEYSKRRN